MNYDFCKLILKFAQAFLDNDTEQLKAVATQLKEFDNDENRTQIIDTITTYVDQGNSTVSIDTIKTVLENAGIENYQSFIYFLELNGVDPTELTPEEFKQKNYYQYFMTENNHINDSVSFSFNNRLAYYAVLLKEPTLIQEVLTRIEQLESE